MFVLLFCSLPATLMLLDTQQKHYVQGIGRTPTLQRQEKRVTLESSLKGTISMPCLWLTPRQGASLEPLFPFPHLVCLERTQHRVVHRSAVLQRRLLRGTMSADTRSTCAPHTGKFFSAHKVSLWKGTQKARLCAALRSG